MFEVLEPRTLLSTLPLPTVTTHTDVSPGPADVNQSAPSIAYDPKNPQKLVMVYTTNDPDAPGTQVVFTSGQYSSNGGASWTSFNIPDNVIDPTASNSQPTPYQRATDASVAFDLNDNFYIVNSENSNSQTEGEIVLQKYSFTTNTPVADAKVKNENLYQWSGADFALTPTLAIDNNQASFTDPTTNAKQVDPSSGTIYVAWATQDKAFTNAPSSFNPNTIRLTASSDSGVTFSAPVTVNSGGNSGTDRDGSPKLAVSQGTSDGRVQPGQLTVIWDDFNSGRTQNPKVDIIKSRVLKGAEEYSISDTVGGPLTDAAQGNPDVPATTTFMLPVNVTDPTFTISDLDVAVSIEHGNLSDLSITLTDPSGLNTITLLRNKQNPNGSTNTNQGIAGQDFGVLNGITTPVIFDDSAARNINDPNANAPYTGDFRPEVGSLVSLFKGETMATMNGNWLLKITDNHNGNTGNLNSWSLSFNSGLTFTGADKAIASTTVLGAVATSNFPLTTSASPDVGVGPGAEIASDNTLGSFSPYEGRLYVTYVNRSTASGNPSDNTDIYLATSDDGGATLDQNHGVVNDDDGSSDGFSGANQGSFGRPQFLPSIAVDQTTGTLVMMWYDGRNDPSSSQVATYFTTSIDGGSTFAPDTYLNTPNAVTDAITGNIVDRGPIPDNDSVANSHRDATYGFGLHEGLTVFGGNVYPVWAGDLDGGAHADNQQHIYTATTAIAAGPRIVSSTMGPVSLAGDTLNPAATDGSPKFSAFQVVFDRPIDLRTALMRPRSRCISAARPRSAPRPARWSTQRCDCCRRSIPAPSVLTRRLARQLSL